MREVVIVDYLRTPISKADPQQDFYKNMRMDDLCALVIRKLVERTGVRAEEIEECIVGCSNQGGEQWTYGGRIISLMAGLPFSVAALGVDRQGASSLESVSIAAMEIAQGYADMVIAAGMEHMLHMPIGSGVTPSLQFLNIGSFDVLTALSMGLSAEKLAQKFSVSREDMDRFSLQSHMKAVKAQREGFFKEEILPIEVILDDGSRKIVDYDQNVRPDTSLEKLSALPPAFKENGLITAGNSTSLNDGAAACILMSKQKAQEYGLKPLATIRSMGWAGVDPTLMGYGNIPAIRKTLERAKLKVEDIDFWEINELFAVIVLVAIRELNINPQRVNVKGGAIALGHPTGMSGVRIVGTLARILNKENGRYGIASTAAGGGQGQAILLEKSN
ncbi:MAG: acetyl-CoA C-acetyltransferase [Candidatus Freyarchaeota archaeon]|nr:acetyl-CoA C-acetyltransferase [Candidatus Jordarchaeia archaeon]MBS7269894.1 acetyl-CoA C-acetyltransferase [Candidatus Jordarchaeia archaeon]MBS7279194.1 acetyl-CoA C-acetyltransferase [Candidatus Jordarchaeia archaeon]